MWCWILLLVSVPVLLVKSQANEMFKGGLTSECILISVPSSIRLTMDRMDYVRHGKIQGREL